MLERRGHVSVRHLTSAGSLSERTRGTRAQVRRQASRGRSHPTLNQSGQDLSLVSSVNRAARPGEAYASPTPACGERQLPTRRRKTRREPGSGGAGETRRRCQNQVAVGQRSSSSCVHRRRTPRSRERRTGAGGQHRRRSKERRHPKMRLTDDLTKLAVRIATPPPPYLPARNGRGRDERSPHRGEHV
jgi:hypothetical protein